MPPLHSRSRGMCECVIKLSQVRVIEERFSSLFVVDRDRVLVPLQSAPQSLGVETITCVCVVERCMSEWE